MRVNGFLEYHKKLYSLLRSQDTKLLSLRARLRFCLVLLSAALLGCTFFLLFALDFLPSEKNDTASQLSQHLDDYHRGVASYCSTLAGQGIRLSQRLSAEFEQELAQREAEFSHLSDNPRLIEALEDRSYRILEDTLRLADCSGVFVVLDATVNTSIPDSHLSKAGVYLKIANINNCNPISPILLFARGMHEVGARYGHDFHNRWELEFSLRRMPMFQIVKEKAVPNLSRCFFFSQRINFEGTWENMMLLCVPLMSRKGEFMGLCGLEINTLYYKLAFPMDPVSLPPVTGMLACREGDFLAPTLGLNSGAYADNFTDSLSEPLRTERDGSLNRYISLEETFVGLERPITLSPLDGENRWVTALLIPESAYHFSVQFKYMKVALFCLIFLTLVYFLSYRMSRRFIEPILERIGSITTGQAERTEIPEIDDLIEYLSRSDASASAQDVQADMTEYNAFLSNIETLSKAERAVFNLYMKGLSAQEIADHLHLSIHTVKSHNRRIYTKLNVSSRKELLIFINMMTPAERSQLN